MFLEALLFGIILGYIFKGKLKNLEHLDLSGLYLVFSAFAIEIVLFMLVRKNVIAKNYITTGVYALEYILIFIFVILNRKNKFILLMGIGFLLNALAIFSNGGAMPVNPKAAVKAGLAPSVESIKASSEGLYLLQDANTRFWFLGDVIPKTYLRHSVMSIGDIIAALGLMLLITKAMVRKTDN